MNKEDQMKDLNNQRDELKLKTTNIYKRYQEDVELKDSYRSEYEKLSIEEKINYMNSPADSFAWSLYNDSNVYLEL